MKFLLYLFALLLLHSCKEKKKESDFTINRSTKKIAKETSDLTGIFTLKTVNDTLFNMNEYYGFEAEQPYLTFDTTSKIMSGYSGCNGFTAPFGMNNSEIVVTEPPIATEIGCEEGNHWENRLFELLNDGTISLHDEKLTLKGDAVEMVFARK